MVNTRPVFTSSSLRNLSFIEDALIEKMQWAEEAESFQGFLVNSLVKEYPDRMNYLREMVAMDGYITWQNDLCDMLLSHCGNQVEDSQVFFSNFGVSSTLELQMLEDGTWELSWQEPIVFFAEDKEWIFAKHVLKTFSDQEVREQSLTLQMFPETTYISEDCYLETESSEVRGYLTEKDMPLLWQLYYECQ